jgi:nitroreductase
MTNGHPPVTPAALDLPTHPEGSRPWPAIAYHSQKLLDDNGYVEEEWFASGEVDGLPYVTALRVLRPRDAKAHSGAVIVEPSHFNNIMPLLTFTRRYILRAGHIYVGTVTYKHMLDGHVKPSDPKRYGALRIDAPPEEVAHFPGNFSETKDYFATKMAGPAHPEMWVELHRQRPRAQAIMAQVGAAIRAGRGPFEGLNVASLLLGGWSATGLATADYIRAAHDRLRLQDGGPIYHGYYPGGFPTGPMPPIDSAVVLMVPEADAIGTIPRSQFYREGVHGLDYRRPDSDDPSDLFRLYEIAGCPHVPSPSDPDPDQADMVAPDPPEAPYVRNSPMPSDYIRYAAPADATPTTIPLRALMYATLDMLVRWTKDKIPPPRAERLQQDEVGWFATDENGNTLGGMRCADMDVPRATYMVLPPLRADGKPTVNWGAAGTERPFEKAKLQQLYTNRAGYLERYNKRLDELVRAGWCLAKRRRKPTCPKASTPPQFIQKVRIMAIDLASADELLTTTRAVRKRLDFTRPVPREIILDCVRVSQQAPTGGNMQIWRWVIIDDADKRAQVAEVYRNAAGNLFAESSKAAAEAGQAQTARVYSSAQYLVEHLHEAPVLAIPCIQGNFPPEMGFGLGSMIYPAVWSFQLALRARGLGSTLTTGLMNIGKDEAAKLLGLPADVSVCALLPVAYTIGTDFKPAARPPADTIVHWNGW